MIESYPILIYEEVKEYPRVNRLQIPISRVHLQLLFPWCTVLSRISQPCRKPYFRSTFSSPLCLTLMNPFGQSVTYQSFHMVRSSLSLTHPSAHYTYLGLVILFCPSIPPGNISCIPVIDNFHSPDSWLTSLVTIFHFLCKCQDHYTILELFYVLSPYLVVLCSRLFLTFLKYLITLSLDIWLVFSVQVSLAHMNVRCAILLRNPAAVSPVCFL